MLGSLTPSLEYFLEIIPNPSPIPLMLFQRLDFPCVPNAPRSPLPTAQVYAPPGCTNIDKIEKRINSNVDRIINANLERMIRMTTE